MCYWGFFVSYGLWPSTTPDNLSPQVIISAVMLGFVILIQLNGVLIRFHALTFPLLFFPLFALSMVGLGFYNTASVVKDLVFIFCLSLPVMLALIAKSELNLNQVVLAPGVAGGLLAVQNILDYSSSGFTMMFGLTRESLSYLGSEAVVFSCFGVGLFLATVSWKSFLLGLLLIIVSSISIILDGYRGGIFVILLSVLFFAISKKNIFIHILFLIILVYIFNNTEFLNIIEAIRLKFAKVGSNGKLEEIIYLFSLLGNDIPIYGLGAGSALYMPLFDSYTNIQHSFLGYLLVRLGIFGVLYFIIFLSLSIYAFIVSIYRRNIIFFSYSLATMYFLLLQAGYKRVSLGLIFFLLILFIKKRRMNYIMGDLR